MTVHRREGPSGGLTKELLIEYVATSLNAAPSLRIDEGLNLFDAGLVTSHGLLKLVAFVERVSGLEVPLEEITRSNFATVRAVLECMSRLERLPDRSAGADGR